MKTVTSFRQLQQGIDLAGTYTPAGPSAAFSPAEQAQLDRDLEVLHRDGYVVIERLLDPATVEAIKADLVPRFGHFGRNEGLEGTRTQRLYSLLAKTRSCDRLVDHPRIVRLLDRVLTKSYLLSQLQPIYIHPGQKAQILHHDDGVYPIPRPRRAFGAATIFAIDAFTETNGATVVLPGSHTWDDRDPDEHDPRLTLVMPAGSVVFFLGTLWHGGGENRSDQPRLAVSAQYCEPWARTQENMSLAIPRDVVKQCSPAIQSMLGYAIYPPFIGMVNGESPMKLLEDER